ncbi:MAG TPA: uroporphyrinogen-III synthase [Burkholderiaceae bacterium]
MRVLVTRPAAQARDWVRRLRADGVDAVALPLIDIAGVVDPEPLRAAWRALPGCAFVMFVSPNAVAHFFAERPAQTGWPASALAGSPGPGTSDALRAAGVPDAAVVEPAADAEQFDSEALWERLQPRRDWHGTRALFVRGDGGRDWLAERLRDAGAAVEHVNAYRRAVPALDAAARAALDAALAAPRDHLWWFSSAQAIDHLAALVPAGTAWGEARALATHPRIGERARRLGFGQVEVCPAAADAVRAAIGRSIQSIGVRTTKP